MTSNDRRQISQALAKAIAYKNCGKDAEADHWGRAVIELMRDFHITTDRQER